jgi:hypothetical protein
MTTTTTQIIDHYKDITRRRLSMLAEAKTQADLAALLHADLLGAMKKLDEALPEQLELQGQIYVSHILATLDAFFRHYAKTTDVPTLADAVAVAQHDFYKGLFEAMEKDTQDV